MAATTRCHQLALFVVFESPLQMLADAPANYRNQPGFDFLKIVPASWDETRVITGKIGDYVAIARRAGDDWYIGALTDSDSRALELPLDFLGEGDYQATSWADGSGADRLPTRVEKSISTVNALDLLEARMAPCGGFAAQLKRAQ